jgi:hypothetical protein
MPPFLLVVLSVVVLLYDGLTPYEILWKKHTWKEVKAEPAKVSRPFRRVMMQGGISHQPKMLVEGKKTRFGVQEEQALRHKGSSAPPSGAPNSATKSRIVERKVTPKRIHSKYVEKGTLFPYKEKQWYIKLAFQFDHGGKLYRVYDDAPVFTFDSHEEAKEYLKAKAGKWPIKVWVNPDDPNEATAFLDYPRWYVVQVGAFVLAISIIWLLFATSVMARTEGRSRSASSEGEEPGAEDDPGEVVEDAYEREDYQRYDREPTDL